MDKAYESPEVQIILLTATDVITTSAGTESPWGDLGFGEW